MWSETPSSAYPRSDPPLTRALLSGCLGAALAVSAAAFDSPSLYVPGLSLGALGFGAALWVALAARGARLERSLGPASVQEEQPYPVQLELRSGLLPPPGGELVEPLLPSPIPIAGRRSRRVRVDVRFARRGRRQIGAARLRIRDPLWLAVREASSAPAGDVLVLPRLEPVVMADPAVAPGGAAAGVAAELAAAAAATELDSLRPYRPGTPAARIHWPAVARTGTVMERRLVADADSRPLVVLDARRPVDREALDRAVRAAASLAVHLACRGGCGLLLPGERRPAELHGDLGGWPAIHARLALVEEADRPPAAARPHRGSVFWVTAAALAKPPVALKRAGGGGRYLVTAGTPAGPVSFTVAGCSGQRVGSSPARRVA